MTSGEEESITGSGVVVCPRVEQTVDFSRSEVVADTDSMRGEVATSGGSFARQGASVPVLMLLLLPLLAVAAAVDVMVVEELVIVLEDEDSGRGGGAAGGGSSVGASTG